MAPSFPRAGRKSLALVLAEGSSEVRARRMRCNLVEDGQVRLPETALSAGRGGCASECVLARGLSIDTTGALYGADGGSS